MVRHISAERAAKPIHLFKPPITFAGRRANSEGAKSKKPVRIGRYRHHGSAHPSTSTYPILKRKVSRRTATLGGDRYDEEGKSSKAVHGLCFGRIVDNKSALWSSAVRPPKSTERFHGIGTCRRTYRTYMHLLIRTYTKMGPVLRQSFSLLCSSPHHGLMLFTHFSEI